MDLCFRDGRNITAVDARCLHRPLQIFQITVLEVGFLPVAAWEFPLGVWLGVKGFRPSPITTATTAPDTAPAYQTSPSNPLRTSAGPTTGPAAVRSGPNRRPPMSRPPLE